MWTQRAAVEGFAAAETTAAPRACTIGTPLILVAIPAESAERGHETRIPVTLADDRENTWFGGPLARREIEDAQAGYCIGHPGAIEALCTAWQIAIN